MASRYFLAHPDPNISRLAANLISDKYQLSKYHTKFRELEQEEDKLDYLVPREIYSMKDAYILYKIKDIQAKIKEAQNKGDMEQIFDLMKQNAHLNEIKNVLCKELGERTEVMSDDAQVVKREPLPHGATPSARERRSPGPPSQEESTRGTARRS